jgi:hypothetical protein
VIDAIAGQPDFAKSVVTRSCGESPARQAIFARVPGFSPARNMAFSNAVTASTLIAFPGIRRPADGLSQV